MKKMMAVTIEESLYDSLKNQAENENRSLSNLVETLLYRALDIDKSNQ